MRAYILNYADYQNRPNVLFTGHTFGKERKNNTSTKFVVRCSDGCPCLDWVDGGETQLSESELMTALEAAEWINED